MSPHQSFITDAPSSENETLQEQETVNTEPQQNLEQQQLKKVLRVDDLNPSSLNMMKVMEEFKQKEKHVSADPLLKTVLRTFRQHIKTQFRSKYGNIYFHKNNEIHKKHDKYLFTLSEQEGGFGIKGEIFDEFKPIFE